MSDVIVIGGGPAGMMAALTAARGGHTVILLDKNEKTGKKLYITGKGRCNLTNNCDTQDFLDAVCVNRKFLYSAGYGFTCRDTMDFFEKLGLELKTERGGRVFPASDHSSDVISALNRALRAAGVRVMLESEVKELLIRDGRIRGVCLRNGTILQADAAVVATGGLSYPSTGSTGDGFRFAEMAGHSVTECYPSLVPFHVREEDAKEMQGLSLKNVRVTVSDGKKVLFSDQGEMMFTHFGVTGPLILTASTCLQKRLKDHSLHLEIDMKPALTDEQLDARILREFQASSNRHFENVLPRLFPSRMVPVMVRRSGIPGDLPCHQVSREQRLKLVYTTKHLDYTVTALRGYPEAIITRGGVNVKEIDPGTMESKLVRGLYFAGEVLDLDAVTGGYNLQIAWATGYAAGNAIH